MFLTTMITKNDVYNNNDNYKWCSNNNDDLLFSYFVINSSVVCHFIVVLSMFIDVRVTF